MSTNPLALTAAEQGQTAGRHQREAAEQSKLAVQQALEIAAIRARVQGER